MQHDPISRRQYVERGDKQDRNADDEDLQC
jgi:hypothetical protein